MPITQIRMPQFYSAILLLLIARRGRTQRLHSEALTSGSSFGLMSLTTPACLIREKWGYDVGGHGWGNKELQFYTERRKENARVENGTLLSKHGETAGTSRVHVGAAGLERQR